ncbi:MAG: hypothetical protein C7B46_19045 [Sulfobacillus benefaciens]|uniref:Uncharacterized protein n=1 Tax=Sulfobacillus benefaciens TaxID=453960 RepID=A0A2T2X1D4_9FIRM|nr:MAG: hypothetical protein C7B46_19045 [Sulfobacillus benefaciens]
MFTDDVLVCAGEAECQGINICKGTHVQFPRVSANDAVKIVWAKIAGIAGIFIMVRGPVVDDTQFWVFNSSVNGLVFGTLH